MPLTHSAELFFIKPFAMPKIFKDEARRAIEGLRLSAVVLRIFDGEIVHPALQFRAQSPYYSFTDSSGLDPDFLPLWECGVVISGYSRTLGQYQQISLEAVEQPFFSSTSFRGLFCLLLMSLWEDEYDDAALSEIAALFEMPPIDCLLDSFQNQPPSLSTWDQWRAAVIQQYETR